MKKLLIILILLIPTSASCWWLIAMQGVEEEAGEDWTPATFRVYEGSTSVTFGDFKLLLYDSSYNLVAISAAEQSSETGDWISIDVSGTPTDVSASSVYYVGFVLDGTDTYWVGGYGTSDAEWGLSNEGGSYASPTDPINSLDHDYSEHSNPCLWVANDAGQRLVGWAITGCTTEVYNQRDTTAVFYEDATSESSPVTP